MKSILDPAEVLVVIPTLNEEAHIEACLRSLVTTGSGSLSSRIAIADGGSSDRTREIVARLDADLPNLVLVDNPERLQSAGINRAVAEAATAEHRILVRCDAHSVYPPDYVLQVARRLREREVASLVVPMDATGRTSFGRGAAAIVDTPFGSGGSAHRGGRRSDYVDHGHHAGFCLDWFRKVGGYDSEFSHNEDAEYDVRLAKSGGRIWLADDIRVAYTMRDTWVKLAKQYYAYGVGRARTVRKHRIRPKLRQMLPAALVAGLGGCLVLSPLSGWFLLPYLLHALALGAISIWQALAHRSTFGLWAGPALAAMHLPWGAGFLRQIVFGGRRQ